MFLATAIMAVPFVPDGTMTAKAATGDNLTLKIADNVNPSHPTWKYLNVSYSAFPYNLSFRFVVKNNTGSSVIQTITDTGCTQAVGNIYYLNSTDGNFTMKMWFNTTTDASGDRVLDIRAKTMKLLNDAEYNTTSMVLFIGKNSGADEQWVKDDFDSKFYDYYRLQSAASGHKEVKYNDCYWLLSLSDDKDCYDKGLYFMSYGINETGYAWTNKAFGTILDNGIHIAIKFKKEQAYPQVGPHILAIVPYHNVNDLVAIYNNEKIYQEAAEKGYTHVIIWDQWMTPGTYSAYNLDVYDAILKIRDYCHKYGLKFTLYFGWRDFTENGAYNPVTDFSSSNITKLLNAWNNFHIKWKNYIDYYYFDYASPSGKYWKYHTWYYLDPIFKTIRNEGKYVIYNAAESCWWADSKYFIPLKFEAQKLTTVETYWTNLVDGDPYLHTLNYAAVWWLSAFFKTGSSWTTYNSTAANYLKQYCYEWGIVPVGAYHYGDLVQFTPYMDDFKVWKEGAYRTTSIGGLDNTAVLETKDSIYAISKNRFSASVPITPKYAATYNNTIYFHSYLSESATVELMVNSTPDTKVIDMTTGKEVNWTKGSVIFDAVEGHVYKIYRESTGGGAWIVNGIQSLTWYQWLWIVIAIFIIMAGVAIYASPKINVLPSHIVHRRRH